jgi:sugar phosphate isomerase/epimerase
MDNTPEFRDERFEKMKKSLYGTAILGAGKWVVHPLMPCGLEDDGTDDSKRTFEINCEFMTKILTVAKPLGITVCLENMPFPDFSLSKPGKILEIVRAVADNSFGICFDTGHVAVFPELCVGDEVRKLGSFISALHIHDNDGKFDRHLFPFEGIIDWEDFSAALYDINFDDVISLECGPSGNLTESGAEAEFAKLASYAKKIYCLSRQEIC